MSQEPTRAKGKAGARLEHLQFVDWLSAPDAKGREAPSPKAASVRACQNPRPQKTCGGISNVWLGILQHGACDRKNIQARCAEANGQVFVAEQDGTVAGFVAVLAAEPFIELDDPPGTYALVTDVVVLYLSEGFLPHLEVFIKRW